MVGGKHPILLFDGVCNLCRRSVQFVLRHDSEGQFRFVSQQSALGQSLLRQHGVNDPQALNTVYLVDDTGIHAKSTAVLRVLGRLGCPWRAGLMLLAVPRPWRDWAYDFVGKRRYAWFGKSDVCWLPDPALKDRFPD